jgi:hypothetical protein
VTRDDIRKLIGGYATGTLTEAERHILFEAALDDQELFDELTREQALKEALEEPGAKARLIAALAEPSPVRKPAWWKTPITWVGAALAAAAILALVIVRQPQPSQYAQVRTDAPAPPSVSAPSAAPQPALPSNEPVQSKEPPALPSARAQPPALAKKTEPSKDLDASKNAELKATSEAKGADAAPAEPAAAPLEKAERSEKRDAQEDAKSPQLKAKAVGARVPAAPAPEPVTGFRQLSEAGQQQSANPEQQQVQSGPSAQNRRAPAAAAGRAGGVVGGAPAFLAARRPRFAFDYSIEPGRELVIKPTANGYLSVSATESKSRIFPTSGERAVAAGSTTRIPIPGDVQTVTIVFSAGAGDAVDEISSAKDATAGTVEDPSPSPNSRLVIELKVQP